ncbi:SpoIIE family protein phosphatase [Yinghuangia sp. YIM S09857]|uniref:SpoIIE family protein phosphatase n=1 Tax=Yinghuangia sp. YIM S09857 TaxID=3436929 RepID=UPI003F529899
MSAVPPNADEPQSTALRDLAAAVERLHGEVKAVRADADRRSVVDLAKGILVAQLGCDPAEADHQLSVLAERAGASRYAFAADIVDRVAGPLMVRGGTDDGATEGEVGALPADEAKSGGGDVDGLAADEAVSGRGDVDGGVAGDRAESASARLRAAQSGTLRAPDADAAARAMLDDVLAPLGAVAVLIWAVGDDTELALAGAAGFDAAELRRWRHVPPDVDTVASRALTAPEGSVWIPSVAGAGTASPGVAVPGRARAETETAPGRIALTVVSLGRVQGVLETCWPGRLPPPSTQMRRQLQALADLCALVLPPQATGHWGPETDSGQSPAGRLAELADGLNVPAMVLEPFLDARGLLADFRIRHLNARGVDALRTARARMAGARMLEEYPLAAAPGGLYEVVHRVYTSGHRFHAERRPVPWADTAAPPGGLADVAVSRHGDAVLVVWTRQSPDARSADLIDHVQRLARIGGFEEASGTGECLWNGQTYQLFGRDPTQGPLPMARWPDQAHPDDAGPLRRFRSSIVDRHRPATVDFRLEHARRVTRRLRVFAEPVLDGDGALTAIRGACQDASAQHWTEVALAATRDRLLDSEEEAAERNRLARQLQQAIMPPDQTPVDAADLRVAVRYRPAESDAAVGGDWYDAVALPSRRILLAVGDVAGHGIDAATNMVVLRNALRDLAVTGAPPGRLLAWLNSVAHHLTDHVTATVVCGLYDPDTRILRWARAGHLPPIRISDGVPRLLPLPEGAMLGAFAEAEYEESEELLQPGDTLLLYTDGLIERRDRSLNDSLTQLVTASTSAPATLEARLDALLAASPANTDDDTCLIGVQAT